MSYQIQKWGPDHNNPESKVHRATMGPPGSFQPQMGPMLAPWTLLSGKPIKSSRMHVFQCCRFVMFLWVNSQSGGCLVKWFCTQFIAKPGNKTCTRPWLYHIYIYIWFVLLTVTDYVIPLYINYHLGFGPSQYTNMDSLLFVYHNDYYNDATLLL